MENHCVTVCIPCLPLKSCCTHRATFSILGPVGPTRSWDPALTGTEPPQAVILPWHYATCELGSWESKIFHHPSSPFLHLGNILGGTLLTFSSGISRRGRAGCVSWGLEGQLGLVNSDSYSLYLLERGSARRGLL